MDLDTFVAAVAQRGMSTSPASAAVLSDWGRIAWERGIRGFITLHTGALYVHAFDDDEHSTKHGPFATFDEAYAIYVLLGSCRAGN